jgi:1A family penicillin-binding protein
MRTLLAVLLAIFLAPLVAAGMFFYGWWTYHRLERSIVEKMDQYYLNITTPDREEYLLSDDEVFEVPYLASKLSVEAVPTRIFDSAGRLIGEFSSEKALYVRSSDDIPTFLKKALVATEDGTFYEHHGINYRATARAMLANLRHLRMAQGGSTITQQLAKMMFTTRKKTLGRKIFEAFCARKLEQKFTKDQILLMYLNFAYFGHGCNGVEAAARFYFGKSTADLELGECALLAGIVNSPIHFSPYEHRDLAKARQHTVLVRMAKLHYISQDVDRLWNDFWVTMDQRLKAPETSFWRTNVNEAPYLVETVRRALEKDFDRERILKGGLRVRTTFDLDVQKAAQAAVRDGLDAVNHGLSSGTAKVVGGLAAVRPSDGAVLALVGGSAFNFSDQLNRAKDIARPVGSSIKPFVYAVAFESGRFHPEDKMLDAPVKYHWGGHTWAPQNYDRKYFGEVTLSEALHRSLNSVAIKLLDSIDIDAVIKLLSQATGIPRPDWPRNLTLALGTADISPLQLAGAYSLFVNGGRTVRPYYIVSIEDRDGAVVKAGGASDEASQVVLSSATCATMVSVMQGVFAPHGTAYGAAKRTGFNLPAAGKTGTTNDYRDAWMAGVTPELSAAVWVGHDDMRIPLGHGETGGVFAAPIWMNFVKAVYRNRPTKSFN